MRAVPGRARKLAPCCQIGLTRLLRAWPGVLHCRVRHHGGRQRRSAPARTLDVRHAGSAGRTTTADTVTPSLTDRRLILWARSVVAEGTRHSPHCTRQDGSRREGTAVKRSGGHL